MVIQVLCYIHLSTMASRTKKTKVTETVDRAEEQPDKSILLHISGSDTRPPIPPQKIFHRKHGCHSTWHHTPSKRGVPILPPQYRFPCEHDDLLTGLHQHTKNDDFIPASKKTELDFSRKHINNESLVTQSALSQSNKRIRP